MPPFDLCKALSWADVPAAVRGTEPPEPRTPAGGMQAACALRNSHFKMNGTKVVSADLFTVYLMWVSEARVTGSPAHVRIGAKTAILVRQTANGHRMCRVAFQVSRGWVAVFVDNQRFPSTDACAVAVPVARGVTSRAN